MLRKVIFLVFLTLLFNSTGCKENNNEKYLKIIEDCRKDISKDPNDYWSYNVRGIFYHSVGQYKKAILDHRKALSFKEIPSFYSSLSYAYLGDRQLNLALIAINKSIEKEKFIRYYSTRGFCYDLMNDIDKALNDYNIFLSRAKKTIDRRIDFIYFRRAYIYYKKENLINATKDLNKSIEICNLKPYPYYLLSLINLKNENYDLFIDNLIKALKRGYNDKKSILQQINNSNITDKSEYFKIVDYYICNDIPVLSIKNNDIMINEFFSEDCDGIWIQTFQKILPYDVIKYFL